MNAHTLTASFDDERVKVSDIIDALKKAGYTVPDYHQASPES
ncbi:hypothetical protein MK489_23955 [Myxococcota bacterium]|nr:hypothetical protein [Myxococcota bacterium]